MRLIILWGLLVLPFTANAESGNELYKFCGEPSGSFGSAFCFGYTGAMADVLVNNSINGFAACLPESGVTFGQINDIVYTYLDAHPELRHYNASGLVARALGEAFPC